MAENKTRPQRQDTAPRSPQRKTDADEDERLQLSVVCHDLLLDPPGPASESVKRFAIRSTPQPSPPPRRTARHTRVSMLDEPDELFVVTRNQQLSRKKNWVLPIIYFVCLFGRLVAPLWKLRSGPEKYQSILSPGPSFYYMLVPVCCTHLVLAVAAMSPLLRGTKIIQSGTAWYLPCICAFEVAWLWWIALGKAPTDAMTFAVLNGLLSAAQAYSVAQQRKAGLSGIWHHATRFSLRVRDFWCVELAVTAQLLWAFFLCLITPNYYTVFEQLEDAPLEFADPSMGGRQMATAIGTIVALSVGLTLIFTLKKRGDTFAAAAGAWFSYDMASSLAFVPDVVSSPQLGWIEPHEHILPLYDTFFCLCVLFMLATIVSAVLHLGDGLLALSKVRGNPDSHFSFLGGKSFPSYPTGHSAFEWDSKGNRWDRSSDKSSSTNGSKAMSRRPSEFMMRSLSSMTNGETPMIALKKPAAAPVV